MNHARTAAIAAGIALAALCAWPQSAPEPYTTTGHVLVEGRSTAYIVHHLPPNAFPDLPASIAAELTGRGCLIPQTYEAHQPENVIHGSFERAGSKDWAALCSADGTASLLVFFGSAPQAPIVIAAVPETDRLQAHGPGGVLGFDWGIDAASPRAVHDMQSGLAHRPPAPDHDALADSVIDQSVVYHFFTKAHWTFLESPAN
ncbi:MAG TPA: hypothetical protein VG893_14455 [Terracidiphilus sp.]|nr:hypothetical protein [Terracidiphilus sp.]